MPHRGNLELLCALAGDLLFSLETLNFGTTRLCLNSPLRLAGCQLRRAGFDLAQLGKNLFELRASQRERRLRLELALPRFFQRSR